MFTTTSCRPGLVFGSVVLALSMWVPGDVRAQEAVVTEDVDSAVREAAGAFVRAFNDLDWGAFEASWAEDATAFFPVPGSDRRVEGREAVVGLFRQLFADFPEREPGPPYLSIDPLDVHVQATGGMAIVSFHLGDAPPYNRRTLVFEKRGDRWLIVHLHASRGLEG